MSSVMMQRRCCARTSDIAPGPLYWGQQQQQRTRREHQLAPSAYSGGPFDLRRDLSVAVRKQATTQLRQLRQELLDPWFAPPPPPLTDTQDPALLGDGDSRFIDVQGLRVHYKQIDGDSSRPAVLMLHGFNGSTFNWRDVMEGISVAEPGGPNRTIVAFDRPPFGLTERPLTWEGGADADPYTCKGGARLAWQLLDSLGIQSAVVIGHSMGAAVAMEMLKESPDQVAGLGLVAPALPAWPDTFRRSLTVGQQLQALARLALMRSDTAGLTYVRRMLTKQASRVAREGVQGIFHDELKMPASDMIDGYLKPMKADNWDRGSLLGFRAFSFPDDLPKYESIKQPVLIVQGVEDKTIPRSTAVQIADRLRSRGGCLTTYVEFPQCGHIPMEENPSAFIDAVSSFLAETIAAPSSGDGRPMDSADLEPTADTIPVAAAGTSAASVQAVR